MKLLPSLKERHRYIVFEIKSEEKYTFTEIKEEVERALLQFLGELGVAKAAPMFLKDKFHYEHQRFILKISPTMVDEVKTALTLSKKIKKTPIIIHSITMSGTLKKASLTL